MNCLHTILLKRSKIDISHDVKFLSAQSSDNRGAYQTHEPLIPLGSTFVLLIGLGSPARQRRELGASKIETDVVGFLRE